MNSNKTNKLKLLLVGAFVTFSQLTTFGQSITAEHYEASGTQTYLFPAPFFASNVRICAQDSVKLTAASFSGSTFTWTLADGSISSITTSSIWVKDQGNYSVSDGTSSATLYVNKETGKPEIYSSSYPVTEELLRAAGSDSNRTNPGTLFSFFSSTSKQNYIAPVGKEYTYNKQQYLITSSELTAMGFAQGSTLKSLGFYFNESWSGCNSNGYNLRIQLYPTTLTAMSGSFVTSGGQYLGDYSCVSHDQGWNYYDFGNNYTWDGTSDLVFDFSYYNENGSTNNPSIAIDQTSFDATTISISPNVDLRYNWPSAAFVKSAGNYRPSLSFKYSRAALKDTIVSCASSIQLDIQNGSGSNTYTWASTGGLSSSTSNLSVSGSDLVYLSSVSSNLCLVQDTVQVLESSVTQPTITASSTDFCEGETVTLSTTIPADHTASWSDASSSSSITVSEGGGYTVAFTNGYGCSNTSPVKSITEIKKPVLLKAANFVDIYANADITFETGGNYGTRIAKYFGDYGGKKYFISRESVDSATYANIIESNAGAEHVAIDNQDLDKWVISTHNDLYNSASSDYPYTLQTGVKWDESAQTLKGIDGVSQTYESWYNDPYTSLSQDKWFVRYHQNNTNLTWWDTDNFDNGGFLVSYSTADIAVQNGDIYCDSVQLFAPADFDTFLWSTGETSSSIWVSGTGSHSIYLTGTYTKSDGTTCSLTSDTYTFTINPSPSLSITNNSNTVDLTGSNYIDLEAVYTSGASLLWSTGVTGDTVNIYSSGDYSVTASLNGCSTTQNVQVYEPIYVAKTGNNTTGDGSFSSPYLTIQKGIDVAIEGQKIYVLPGTYSEGELDFETSSGVYKSVYLASDLVRTGDSTAIAGTKIDADGDGSIINVRGSNSSVIQGFTLTGQETSAWESSVIYLSNGANLQFKNIVIKGNTWVQDAQAHCLGIHNSSPIFEDVLIEGHGNSSTYTRATTYISGSNTYVTFNNVVWKDNFAWDYGILGVWSGATVIAENNLFIDNGHSSWRGIINIHYQSTVTLLNSTVANNLHSESQLISFWDAFNTTRLNLINSVLGDMNNVDYQIYNNGYNEAYVTARNSVIPGGILGSNQPTKINWDVDASNVFTDPQLDTDGTLLATSPAIGIATKNPVTIGSTTYTPPLLDLAGVTRPDPAGSNPDAGAYESDKAQGDLDIILTQCAYLLEATVLNSTNYTYSWSLNGTVVSTDLSYLATALGTYTFEVVSTDRSQTISEDIILNDPLTYDLVYANNNCSVLSSDNGEIRWGGVTGGDRNTVDYWEYRSGINNENGTQYDGIWNVDENSWYNTRSSMPSGKYFVYVEDNSGCIVGDTVEIADQARDTYYVSTTGSNSNSGTSATDAFASIATAVDYACTNDTIILLDGTYYEDSLEIKKNLVIGSQYLFDNDTNHIAATVIDGENSGWIMRWESGSSWSDTATNQLVGLTIQNGNSTNSGYAGGVRVLNSRALSIAHVVFKNNQNNQNVGGALWTESSSRIGLKNVVFDGNSSTSSGSAWYAHYSYSYGRDLIFKNNISSRDAIHITAARGFDVANVKVRNNSSSSERIIYLNMYDLQSDAVLSNWEVRNNTAQSWMIQIEDGSRDGKKMYYNNWLVADNTTSSSHPGINFSNTSGTYVFNNLTVWNNITSSNPTEKNNAQMWQQYSNQTTNIVIANSIIGSTNEYALTSEDWNSNTTISVDYSFIEGGASKTDGGTNTTISLGSSNVLSGSPYFTDAANGDYSLSNVSTLLGAGASTATVGGVSITAPTTDLYGNPRPNPSGTNPDIGAIESPESAPQVGIAAITTDNGFCQTTSGAITANLLNYTGTATYAWSSSTYPTWTWSATQSATGLSSGDYKVVAIDATSGAKLDSTEITIATLPSISITNTSTDVTCFGDDDGELTFEIYGGNPLGGSQYTYSVDYLQSMAQATGVVLPSNGSWFDNDNNSNARTNKYNADNYNGNPIYQGKYYVSVSDQDGCTFTDTVEVGYDHALPVVNITTLASDGTVGLTSMCEGTGNTINLTANVTGGGGTNTFSWSNASTAQTVGVAQTDDYIVEVTDQYTCVGKDTMSIYFQAAPQLVLEGAGTPLYNGTALPNGVGNYNWGNNSEYLGNYDGSAYYLIQNSYQSADGIAIAKALGGKLATPRTKAESDWLADKYADYGCCNAMIGARYDGTTWVDFDGNELTWSNWWGNSVNGVGNPLHGNPSTDNYDMATLNTNKEWYNYQTTDHWWLLLEFPAQDAPVTFNQAFCDSVELKANSFVSADGPGFTEIYWTDAQGDTINETEYNTFYADTDVTLHGTFVRSDGQTCEISSTTYSFDVFSSPNLVVTNYSGSVDLLGGDSIVLVASTDIGTISWINASGTVINNDTLYVTQQGTYTARAVTSTCESTEEVQIYKPIYVATTGSNTNGDGTFANPFETIQYGVNTVAEGGKVYVLPGTYEEQVLVTKGLYLMSNYERLNDSSAIGSTIIKPGSSSKIEDQNISSKYSYGGVSVVSTTGDVTISGFTIKDFEVFYADWWRSGAISINENVGYQVAYKNIVVTGTKQKQNESCCSAAKVITANNSQNVVFDNVTIKNSGSSVQDIHRLAYMNDVKLHATELKLSDNYSNGKLFSIENNSEMTVVNSIFDDGLGLGWSQYPIYLEGGSDFIAINSTFKEIESNPYDAAIYVSGSGSDILLFNTLIDAKEVLYHSGSNNTLEVVNSLIPSTADLDHSGLTVTLDSTDVIFGVASTNNDYSLPANSMAIGKGKNSHTWKSALYSAPSDDIYGKIRPTPQGSTLDIGAVESDKSLGDFDLLLTQCGYLLEASVLNTNAYTIEWLFNGSAVSSSNSFVANSLGIYTANVYSQDRLDTIVKTIAITDPLRFETTITKNNCTDVGGGNNGRIEWGRPKGGTSNSNNNFYSWIENSAGGYVWGNTTQEINHADDWNGTHSVDGLGSDTYYVIVSDASGCSIIDTVLIEDQDGGLYYVSNQGDNSNDGLTASLAFETIEYALTQVCDQDTIILLDGIYYEDSLHVTTELVIASEYLLDLDTSHISNTIIDGENDGWIMFWQAGSGSWTDTTSNQLVGLTIQNGNSTNSSYAGGLKVDYNRGLKLDNIRFKNNVNNQNSGGALWTLENARIALVNVDFIGNSSSHNGSGWYSNYSYVFGRKLTFKNHTGTRDVLHVLASRGWDVSDVEITNNTSTNERVIYMNLYDLKSDAYASNWLIQNNTAGSWMIQIEDGSHDGKKMYYNNWLVVDNSTTGNHPGMNFTNTAGDYIFNHLTVWNNITSSNPSSKNNAQMWQQYSNQTTNIIVANSIIGSTNGYALTSEDWNSNTTISVDYTTIEGGTTKTDGGNNTTITLGSSVVSSAPYFTSVANGDYSLSAVSPLIGAGATTATVGGVALTAPTTDLYGNPRPNPSGTNPDLGAIEATDSIPNVGIAAVVTNNGFCQTTSGAITANLLNYSGTGGVAYSWTSLANPTQPFLPTTQQTGLASGDYAVVAKDAMDGTVLDSIVVTVGTAPNMYIVNTSTDVTCFGDNDGELSFEIFGGNPLGGSQYTYSIDYQESLAQADGVLLGNDWYDTDNNSNNRNGKYISDNWNGSPNYQGSYYVTATDQDGCTFSDTVKIGYEHALPVVSITTLASDGTAGLTSMCSGTGNTINLTANVTGGGGTNSFTWSNASTASTVTVATTANYYVEAEDQYTCMGKDTIDIYFQSAPQLVIENGAPAPFSGQALTGTYASNATYLGEHENHHYYMVQNSQSWTTAKAAAEALGGYLAIPNDAAENQAIENMVSNKNVRADAWLGIYWNGSEWIDVLGNTPTYTNWWGSTNNSALNNSYDDYPYAIKDYNGTAWYNQWKWDNWSFIIEFAPSDLPVAFGQDFCDSIELKVKPFVSADGPGFTEIYWTDSQGDTINETEYKTFYADSDVTLNGVFTRSDGQECSISSIQYSFDVFNSPNLLVTNYSGYVDLLGGDSIVLVASTDIGAVSWIDSAGTVINNDTLYVTQPGTYTARAVTSTCESLEEVQIYKPIYVAKTGSDANGDGTFANPFLTIQKGIDIASEGQKIYVLPGIYSETVDVDKSVTIESDFIRLDNANAKNTTVIDGNGDPCISIENVSDDIFVTVNGFKLRDASHTSNANQGAIHIKNSSNTTFSLRNSSITQSANSGDCCGRGGIINIETARRVEFISVDIHNNGSLTQEARFPINLVWINSGVLFENSKIRSNGFTQWLFQVYGTELTFTNSIIAENTSQWNDREIFNLEGSDVSLTMNHTTVYGNDQSQEAGLFRISYGTPSIEVYNSILDVNEVINTSEDYTVSNSLLRIGNVFKGNGLNLGSNNIQSNIQLQSGYKLPATSPAIGLGDISLGNIRTDYNGWSRPLPAGSNPDAGAIEDSLAVGKFDILLSQCGNNLNISVLNTTAYNIEVTGPANYLASNVNPAFMNILGQYSVTVYDSISESSITKSLNFNNPLNTGFIFVRNACPSNNGLGQIMVGDFTGGTDIYPSQQWHDYDVYVLDTNQMIVWSHPVHQGSGSRWNTSLQAGEYYIQLTDGSGCSVYDTVIIEDLIGSKYYISTTGSDAATGTYTDPLATIQEALNRTCDGDTIVLFDGEYFENIDYTSPYLPYVTIASEFIEDGQYSHIANTIVNGMDEDPVFDISQHGNTSDTIIFVGFTITNGKSSNWYGGGGISVNYSDVALKDMLVTGNRSGHDGGGIGMDGGELNLWNTLIYDNIASGNGGGIRANYMERLDGHGSTIIENNKANSDGGGISYGHGHWGSTEDFYIKGFEVRNNSSNSEGGGIHISNWGNNNSTLEIENIKVVNNRSIYGNAGGLYISNNGEDAIMSNVIIAKNRSNGVGGLKVSDTDLDIVHTTIYSNPILDGTSSNDQIELRNNANVLFLNSAVGGQQNVGNSTAHTFYFNDGDTTCDLTIVNSIISGGVNSIDNSYSSPVSGTPIGQALYLVDPGQGDYMLSPVSQGLGAGVSAYSGITMPYVDIEGTARPNPTGSNPDVGAVESPLDTATFGAAYEIRNNIACDPTYGRLKVIPLNGSGSYKYELDDLTGSATFSDQLNVSSWTYSSLYSGDYLVTITDLSSSSVFTDTVSIFGKDTLNLILTYNDIFCAGEDNGSISAGVTGGDGYYDYTWTTISNSNWPKSNKLNNLYPDEYFVTVKDGDNCFIEDSVTLTTLHNLPAVSITGNINKGGSIVQTTNPQVRACAGDIVTLDAGAGFVSYNWTTIDQLNSWTTQTLSASYEDGFYVTVIDSFGCANSDTAQVFYVQSPSIFASNVNTNIGSSYQQVTSYVEGSNQSTGFNSEPKPYGASERFAKMQFIIPASELIAEGLTDQTSINSLGFEVDLASGSPVQNFKIKLKNTTSNQVGYTFETGLTEVYSFNILTAGEGWNTHEFDQDFVWDGTKNLLVQVEYSNVAFTNASNSYLVGHQTSYTSSSVATDWSSSVSNQTSAGNTFSWRPNMKFGIDKVQATDTLRVCDLTLLNTTDDYDTYSWLVNGTSQSTQLRYSMNSPNVVVLQTVDAASSCTMYSDTVQVLLDTTPSVFVTSPSLVGCIGDSVIASVDTVKSNLTYAWSNGVQDTIASFTESGDYYIYAISPSGCQGVDTVNVSINIPPDVVMELNGRVLTSTDGSLIADNSSCDTTLILPYFSSVDTLSPLNASEWDTYSSNFLEWEYQQGWDSLVDYTGPTYDADSNFYGGFYQFDPASLTDQNKVGYLELGCINLLGMSDPYISFAYHMVDVYADSSNTADQMGSLEFQVKTAGDAQWTTLWLTSGTEQAYTWVNKTIGLSSFSNQTIQVRWKGTAGVGGPRSEIGLDNVSVTDASANLSNVSGRISPETVCEGDSLFASTVSNGTSNFTFLWSNGETTSGIELHTSGWYSVQVTDDKSCGISTDSVYITVNPAPNNLLTLSDTTQYCFGVFDSIVISAVPGYDNYEWIVGQQLSSPSATYCDVSLILTDSYGDGWNNGTIQIKDGSGTVLTTLGSGFMSGFNFIDSVSLVSGTSYTIDVSNGGGYPSEMGLIVILGGDTIASYVNSSSTGTGTVMASITPNCEIQGSTNTNVSLVSAIVVDSISLGTTSYYVTITDSIGCKATSEAVDLIERVNPALSFVSSAVLCNGDTTGAIDLTATGGGGFVYDWSNGADSSNLTGLSTGWYNVAVTDSFSCETVDSVFVSEPTVLSLNQTITSDVNCFGGSDGFANYTFTGGVGAYVYSWSDSTNSWSSDSLNLSGAPAGLYFLNASDSNGCFVLDTVGIDQPSLLVLTIDSTSNLSCYQNADGYVSASVVGGFGSYSYYIDGMMASSLIIDSLNAGTHVVSVVDDNGCSDSASFTLTEPALLTASTNVSQYLGGIQVSCNGATDGSIDVFVNGGTLPYSFLWTDGDTTEDRSNIGAGSYSMTITDEQGCTVSVNELISEPTALVATSLVDSLDCYGASDGSIAYTLSGATAPYITSWSSNTGSSPDSVLATFQVNMNGASINTGGIELITNSGQNYNMNLVPVLEDSIYRVTIPVAVGSTLEYRFFNGSTAETVSSSCGVNVAGTIYRSITISSDTTLVAIEFSGCTTTGSAYSGALTGSTRSLTGLSAGSYELTISDVNGCNTILTDSLIEPDSIQITAFVYDASCPQTPDGFVDVTATGGSGNLTYLWSTGDTTQDLTASYGYYTLTVTDAKGCMDSATFLIDAPFPYNDEELCVVTVDTTGVNLVVWEKTPSQRTADYVILRENAATQYVSVGNNAYLNMSTWADQNSNPAVQPYRYKLVLQDSCGNYSDTSDYHATIHLQASQGVAQNEVNLQWTAYEGKQVQTYYIYRWLSPINRVLVDSVSSNVFTYTDIYPVTTTITALLYEVGAKFVNGGCSPSIGKQSSYANSMSNVLDWGQDGGLPIGTEEWVDVVLGNDLDIYPNPTLGSLNLELKGSWEEQEDIQIKVTDMTGRILAYRITQGAGTVRFDFEELPAGIYFLNIITGEGRTIVKRFERIN